MGIELIDLAWVLAAVACGFALSKVVYFILSRYVTILTSKTKTSLDDRVIDAIDEPLSYWVIAASVYLALNYLPAYSPYLPQVDAVYQVIVIILGAYTIVKLGDAFIDWYIAEVAPKSKVVLTDFLPVFKRLFNVFVFIIALIMSLSQIGVEVSPLIASLGIAGLAVALAFQDTLSNFFGGINITADRPLKVGDYIKLENGEEGHVQKIGWRTTQIRTPLNNVVIIPNSKLAQSIITNFNTQSKESAVSIPCSVAYGSDLERVEKIALEVAVEVEKKVDGGVRDFTPAVRFTKFGADGIEFSTSLMVREFNELGKVRHEFIKRLYARFTKEKIEIPQAKRDVYIRQGKL